MSHIPYGQLLPPAIHRLRTCSFSVNKSAPPRYERPSFVFDIDGVVSRGGNVIPAALTALNQLFDTVKQRWTTPTVFLTNGGGISESERANRLSNLLGIPIDASMIVLSHTPLREFVHTIPEQTSVLTVGNPHCAVVARAYGFSAVLDTSHLAALRPNATPFFKGAFPPVTDDHRKAAALPVSAVFVMTDSTDWGRDTQLLLDVLRPKDHLRSHPQPQLFFCNADLEFPTTYARPRLAGGVFRLVFNTVYESVVGFSPPTATFLGKPFALNYIAAERALRIQIDRMGFDGAAPLRQVFAVGDNPPSDVRGANSRGLPWVSVLVRTGNFCGGLRDIDALVQTDRPAVLVEDIAQAVSYAFDSV